MFNLDKQLEASSDDDDIADPDRYIGAHSLLQEGEGMTPPTSHHLTSGPSRQPHPKTSQSGFSGVKRDCGHLIVALLILREGCQAVGEVAAQGGAVRAALMAGDIHQ